MQVPALKTWHDIEPGDFNFHTSLPLLSAPSNLTTTLRGGVSRGHCRDSREERALSWASRQGEAQVSSSMFGTLATSAAGSVQVQGLKPCLLPGLPQRIQALLHNLPKQRRFLKTPKAHRPSTGQIQRRSLLHRIRGGGRRPILPFGGIMKESWLVNR